MEHSGFFNVPSLVIITGTSRGYGFQLAKSVLTRLQPKSILVLTSKTRKALSDSKSEISLLNKNEVVKVEDILCDLTKADDIDSFFGELDKLFEPSQIQSAILINNAGTLGDVSLTIDKYDHKVISNFFELNVTNAIYFTKKFLDKVSSDHITKCIVNISSLLAIKPFSYFGLYCSAKAARDMIFKVLASERKDLLVLSWAPGPMPTDMLIEVCKSGEEDFSSAMSLLIKDKTYVECKDSAEKLFSLLESCNFTSGDHIDFYDC